jgi:hypothetical protein
MRYAIMLVLLCCGMAWSYEGRTCDKCGNRMYKVDAGISVSKFDFVRFTEVEVNKWDLCYKCTTAFEKWLKEKR